MKTNRYVSIALLVLLAALALSGCAKPQPAGLSDDQVVSVAENLLTAINTDDYTAFSRDFSSDMLAAFPQDQFEQLRGLLQTASGNFVSAGTPSLSNSNGYAVYRIQCTYELEDVVVAITFKVDGSQVEGIFFDSPNLRSATQ